jgi:hypothetical protein
VLLLSACTPPPIEMTIIVVNAPEDLVIQIVYYEELGSFFRARVCRRWWETRYRIPLSEGHGWGWHHDEITISVRSSEFEEFELTFPRPHYGNFTIGVEVETQAIFHPFSHGRNLIIMLLWIISLLAFDSAVFLAFRHKEKQSWKMFIRINLTMQWLFVGAWLIFHTTSSVGAIILSFLSIPLAKIAKFIVEIIMYRKVITEHSEITGTKGRITLCAVLMNILGLIATISLGMTLPLPRL